MKVAIPTANGELSAHFGHCEAFALFTVENQQIVKEEILTHSEHGCGSYPQMLKSVGCSVVLAGGLGQNAKTNLQDNGIQVIHGVSSAPLKLLVEQYIAGNIVYDSSLCDHEHHDHSDCSQHH